jgi:Zn-dependent protease
LAGLTRFAGAHISGPHAETGYVVAYQFAASIVTINILLACFNLLPIPPLDGSRILDAAMPSAFRPYWNQLAMLGPLMLAAVVLVPTLLGFNLLAWPLYWSAKLIQWAAAQ